MKMTTLKSVAIALGLASSAFGQATSPVVGYETLELEQGFNFLGLRLHEKELFSGEVVAVDGAVVTLSGSPSAGTGLSLFEAASGSAAVQLLRLFLFRALT